jgi:6-phosphofructokinase 1
MAAFHARHSGNTWRLSKQLEELTQLETRVTILGYLQRGGTPSASDRLLATRLGTMCVELIENDCFGVMVADHGGVAVPVPITDVAGNSKLIPPDHAWVQSARRVGTCLGD